MLNHEFPQIIPNPQPTIDILETYKVTREFYQEVEERQEFERYCEWYYTTAKHHQQELQKMRGDLNILGWFRWVGR